MRHWLSQYRKRQNVSRQELAAALNISATTVKTREERSVREPRRNAATNTALKKAVEDVCLARGGGVQLDLEDLL